MEGSPKGEGACEGGVISRATTAPEACAVRLEAVCDDGGVDRGRSYLLLLLLRFLHLRVFVSRSFFEIIEGYGKAEEHAPSGTTCCAS
jgi:hypothetical protein